MSDNKRQNNQQWQKQPQAKPPKNPDPMSNPKTMAREGMKILKDIAHEKFDAYNKGHIFRNKEFIKATLVELDKRITDCQIHITAINYCYISRGITDPNIIRLLHRDTGSYEAYCIAKEELTNIYSTGDTGFLQVLMNKLPRYKYNI